VESALPYYETSLQKNWLTVVNVALNANGQVTGLDSTSNACGVAASWCLAAPGYTYFSPVTGTVFSTGAGDGTSGSAAVITGVAALIWQRFPYFTATNVQETLLGTATSLGSTTLYGYGLVNAAAAVNGPGQLNWGVFDVDIPAGVTGTFSNAITGPGSLQLDGSGILILTGANTYSGGTTVNGGMLQINGSLASNVAVNSGGVLKGGAGAVNGNVVANANGSVSTLDGALTIKGNYTAAPTSDTAILIGTPLQVTGTATLNGSNATVVVPSGYTAMTEEPLLDAAGGLNGTFGYLSLATGSVYLSGTFSYTPTEADIALSRNSVASIAMAAMPNVATTQQTAKHIEGALEQADQWVASSPAQHETFLDAAGEFLHVDSIAEAQASINSLSGQLLASSQSLTFEQAGIVNRTVADRLTDIDDGGSRQGAWFQGTGASGDIARSGYATGSYSGGGAVAGYDAVLSDSFTLGAGLDWNRLGSTYDLQAGTSSSRTTGVMLYGKFAADNMYVSGRVGQDWISSTVNRWAVLGTTPAAINSTRDDRLTSAYLEAGYEVRSNAWTTTPFVSLSDDDLSRGAIAESGAGGFGIAAGSKDFNQSNGQLGARLAYHWTWDAGQMWLKGFALYQRVLAGSDLGFTAAYAGAPDASFQLEGVNSPRNSGWVGLGLNTLLNNHWSWFANVDGQVAGGGTKATVFSAGAQFSF
jgi:autotransporter-associated beta strand protein